MSNMIKDVDWYYNLQRLYWQHWLRCVCLFNLFNLFLLTYFELKGKLLSLKIFQNETVLSFERFLYRLVYIKVTITFYQRVSSNYPELWIVFFFHRNSNHWSKPWVISFSENRAVQITNLSTHADHTHYLFCVICFHRSLVMPNTLPGNLIHM